MVTEMFYNCAPADCRRDIHEFISTGEERDLIRLENMHTHSLR
jgi:hypothetical protein